MIHEIREDGDGIILDFSEKVLIIDDGMRR